MSTELPLIMIKDVIYAYPNGTVALKDINLNLYRGELVGIMGKNGAGKTTLIRTLNGLIRPTQGDIYINNKNINTTTIATLSKKVGIIFQNASHQLFANTVEDEIKFSLKSFNLDKEESQIRTNKILHQFNLEKYRERSPLNLSGGESKKLAIASIFCRDPEILIFDEPTLGQDAREIEFFLGLIEKERENGKTIIIITHNIEFAFEFIPRTILMAEGKLIADGPTQKVLNCEELIEKSSLILPQSRQLSLALQASGFQNTNTLFSKADVTKYLMQFFINNSGGLKRGK
ncbi:MAG: ABC transporter ATP-binding protein [Candidatus Lokiarchaeota archaeon]|nr:ABC transporter ATP-binding protein [Candidatus Lokiarchaeota archaeon]